MSQLLYQPAFVSPAVCGKLVRFFKENIGILGGADSEPTFAHRVIRLRSLDEAVSAHLEVKRILIAVGFLVSQRIVEFFQAKAAWPEETQVVVWKAGMQQFLHRDTTRLTTTYAAVIYLNDAFTGGETFFADYDGVQPEAGMMIAFHGARDQHGVKMVRSGTRYTLAIWFTEDPVAAEP